MDFLWRDVVQQRSSFNAKNAHVEAGYVPHLPDHIWVVRHVSVLFTLSHPPHTPSPRCCQAAEMKVNTSTGNTFSHTRRLGRATAISQFQIPGSFGLRNFQYNCYNLQSEFSILNSNHDTEISDFMQISHVYILSAVRESKHELQKTLCSGALSRRVRPKNRKNEIHSSFFNNISLWM